ncbi:glycosyltransferase [uncultured Pelagimonas sp.]|uniref:glycosyltransferase n=1 Tax=uncultured Pelagimonas sp. TaxID=1618102 RepID=UPI002613301D|nr:glycosyltransferase [uncultured Pelagimonas sp.]
MRVLIISDSDWRGGAAKVAFYLAQGLRGRGIEADMLVQQKSSDADFVEELPQQTKQPGTVMRRLQYRLAYGALQLSSLNGRVALDPDRLARYDLVHLHNVPPMSLWDVFRRLRIPTVWTVHSMAPLTGNCVFSYDCDRWTHGCGACPQFGTWPLIYQHRDASAEILRIKRFLYKRMAFHAVGVSDWTTTQIAQSVMASQPRHTVQNPSWTPDYHPVDRGAARKRLGIPENALAVMLSVSGKTEDTRKGLDISVAAARQIQNDWPDAERLFLLPTGIVAPNGEMANILNEFKGLPPKHVADVALLRDYYNAADVVWHPSRADTSSMVSLEAFGAGTPVIAAAVGGVPEIVQHEQSGLLIPPDAPEALAAATRRLIDQPALMAQLRQGALATAQKHNPERFVDEYLAIYDQALADKTPNAA